MPDNTLPEEQKQMTHLLSRCRKAHRIFGNAVVYATIPCIACILFAVWLNRGTESVLVVEPLLLYLIFWMILVGRVVALARKRRNFVRQLTAEEKELLERASHIAPKSARGTAIQVLRIHENIRQSDEQNLLRASAEAENATLLRAAQSADNTPQEQLLRPTDSPS